MLMWLAIQTRPDLANAVSAVARCCASLGILGLVHTLDYNSWMGITVRDVVNGLSIQVFVDADYASKATDRRPVSEGLVMCGGGDASHGFRGRRSMLCLQRRRQNM